MKSARNCGSVGRPWKSRQVDVLFPSFPGGAAPARSRSRTFFASLDDGRLRDAEVEDLQPEHICAILKTDPNRGLSVDKAEERLKKARSDV